MTGIVHYTRPICTTDSVALPRLVVIPTDRRTPCMGVNRTKKRALVTTHEGSVSCKRCLAALASRRTV